MSLNAEQDSDERDTSYQINDNIGDTLFTRNRPARTQRAPCSARGSSEANIHMHCVNVPRSVVIQTSRLFSAFGTRWATHPHPASRSCRWHTFYAVPGCIGQCHSPGSENSAPLQPIK